jgi:alanine racemase
MRQTRKRLIKRNKTCKINYIPGADKDIRAVIDVNAIRNNINYLKKKTGTDLMPVLKADAYGHGLIEMSRILRKLGIKYIGVATLGEAILLRKSGDKGRVLSWLYDIDGHEFKDALKMNLDIAIFDEKLLPKIEKMIPKGIKIKATVFVDTGINRAGVPYENAIQTFKDIVACDKFELVGMMSHLVCSGVKNSPIVNEQLRKFRELRKNLEEIGIKPPLVHIANTGACMNYDVSDFTLSRPGSGIYGITADFKPDKNLIPPMSIKSYIIQVKDVEKGAGIGYDWKFIAPKKMKVCVLPIGYADIVPRDTSLKLHVYINGTKRKVLGTISMDQIIVEARENDSVNDDAYLFGNGKDCPQTIYDLAKLANTIPLEILCHTGYRINRTYINR